MNNARPQRRRAATLVELITGLSITAILMGGLLSAVTLASRAIPSPEDPLTDAIEAAHVAERIAADLYCAQLFSKTTATDVAFSVADRGTINYAWSGMPGDPLKWQCGTDPQVELVLDVHEFTVSYEVATVSKTSIVDGTIQSDEVLLASFDGWPATTPTAQQIIINSVNWASEYFEHAPPEGTTTLVFTRAMVRLSRLSTAPSSFMVAIHRSLNGGSGLPESAPIGTPASVPGNNVSTTSTWVQADFSDVKVTDLSRTDYCLVVSGVETTPLYGDYYWARRAPPDVTVMRWTADGGATWEPTRNYDENDLRFAVYGRYETGGTTEVTVDKHYLKRVRLALQIGDNAAARVETAIPILNAPEVALP